MALFPLIILTPFPSPSPEGPEAIKTKPPGPSSSCPADLSRVWRAGVNLTNVARYHVCVSDWGLPSGRMSQPMPSFTLWLPYRAWASCWQVHLPCSCCHNQNFQCGVKPSGSQGLHWAASATSGLRREPSFVTRVAPEFLFSAVWTQPPPLLD